MTAGHDLHDIHTVLYAAAQWPDLHPVTRNYMVHRMRLLYIAVTKGCPAALYYNQQGADEFLDVEPAFGRTSSLLRRAPERPREEQLNPGDVPPLIGDAARDPREQPPSTPWDIILKM
jgi:hypothetical protein